MKYRVNNPLIKEEPMEGNEFYDNLKFIADLNENKDIAIEYTQLNAYEKLLYRLAKAGITDEKGINDLVDYGKIFVKSHDKVKQNEEECCGKCKDKDADKSDSTSSRDDYDLEQDMNRLFNILFGSK